MVHLTLASLRMRDGIVMIPVEPHAAFFTIESICVAQAIMANSTTQIFVAQKFALDLVLKISASEYVLVKMAAIRMVVAVTFLASVRLIF